MLGQHHGLEARVTTGSCYNMTMYVYDIPSVYIESVVNDVSKHVDRNCLLRDCDVSWNSKTNILTYSPELFILSRLLSQCKRTADPTTADFFLFPFPFALWQASGWIGRRSYPNMIALLRTHLTHIDENNSNRHVFLDTNDSVFMISLHKHCENSIMVHLGDDLWSGQLMGRNRFKDGHFKNSIVVHIVRCCRCNLSGIPRPLSPSLWGAEHRTQRRSQTSREVLRSSQRHADRCQGDARVSLVE